MDITSWKRKHKVELVKALEPGFRNEEDQDSTVHESLEKNNLKNPLLISPVIRCVLNFLNIDDIKNCRLVCHEWGSTGKLELASRARINIHTNSPDCRPVDFQSCFLNSATLFSEFQISSNSSEELEKNPTTIEELNIFFEDQQKSIKELELKFHVYRSSDSVEKVKIVDISSWISKSPMVQKGVQYMTKLSIEGDEKNLFILPFHLIAEIKDLALSNCRINLDAEIKICPTKLKFEEVTFHQDGMKLDRVRINDIVELCKTEELMLYCSVLETRCRLETKCIIDLCGNNVLQKLFLKGCEIMNGETSQWVVERLAKSLIPYSLNNQMKIKELSLFIPWPLDLFTLPISIQKFVLRAYRDGTNLSCSQPILWENLEYLHFSSTFADLSHFNNCHRLSHLKFSGYDVGTTKFSWMPKNLKTLTLEDCTIDWGDDICLNLEKLIFRNWCPCTPLTCRELALKLLGLETKIRVQDLVFYDRRMAVDEDLVYLLDNRNRFSYVNRIYVGELDWEEKQLEDSVLKEYVGEKSSFYVFESEKRGRAISEKAFYALIPKHMELEA